MTMRLPFTAIALGLTVAAVPVASNEPISIEIRTGGDDGLTQQLRTAIEERLRSSGRFVLGPASSNPDVLRMAIPNHVEWERVRNRTRVRYQLEFSRGGGAFGFFRGTCWEDEMAVCARQALFAATSALEAD